MYAKVLHFDLNARGGAERLSLVTIKALMSMGLEVRLATSRPPDTDLLKTAFGAELAGRISGLPILDKTDESSDCLTINTHGDILPFAQKTFTKKNSIVYCHYPLTDRLVDLNQPEKSVSDFSDSKLQAMKREYSEMLLNSTILTNSEFSRRAVFRQFGVDSIVLPPPVDVESFRSACLWSGRRQDLVLVISRYHPTKKLENVIEIAKLLKKMGIGDHVKVVGNLSPSHRSYYNFLIKKTEANSLSDFVSFEVNVSFRRLLDLLNDAKVYFHPMPEEPFGISTVEAMSAGLVPVVPDAGGHTEFVPPRYHYHTAMQAVAEINEGLDVSDEERIKISRSTQKFSTASYIEGFIRILNRVTGVEKKTQAAEIILQRNQGRPALKQS